MQMKALRSLNFAKLSSSSSTRDVYWVTSISLGTPAGYCLSQIRSMVFPLWFDFPFVGRDSYFSTVLSNAKADGKRRRVTGPAPATRTPPGRLKKRLLSARRDRGLLVRRRRL